MNLLIRDIVILMIFVQKIIKFDYSHNVFMIIFVIPVIDEIIVDTNHLKM